MNRINLRLLNLPAVAILLILAFSSAAYAEVDYSFFGTLSLASGEDPLGYDGVSVSGTATLSQTTVPFSTMTTSNYSTTTFNSVSGVLVEGYPCSNTPNPAITLTDNAGAPDTIILSNCVINGIVISANIIIPDGNMITALPAMIPLTYNVSGTVSYSYGNGPASVFNITNASIQANDESMMGGDVIPAVTPSITSWTPTTSVGSTIPLTQPVTFTTSPANPDAAVSFLTSVTTNDGGTWLSVSPSATNTSSTLMITVNPTGLTQSFYSGTVTLNYGQGLSATIPVTLTLAGGAASLSGPALMTFNYTLGGAAPASQTLNIAGVSGASINAAVTAGNSWLSVSPGSGTTPAAFTVSVNTAGLTTAQSLGGNIQITSSGLSPLNIPVTLNVSSSSVTVGPTSLTFNYTIGGSQPSAQNLSVSGTSGLPFSTSTVGAWIVASPSGNTVPGSVGVSINTSGLTAGTYNGTVSVTSPGAAVNPASIPVTLNVTAPSLTATPSTLNFSYQVGGSTPAPQPISVGGTPGLSFTAQSSGAWLSVSPGSGTTGGSVSASVNTSSLAAGTYNGTILITATGAASQTVNVTLVVTQPAVTATPSALNFSYQLGAAAPVAQSLTIGGTAGLTYTATPPAVSWLSLSNTSGAIPGSISVSINTSSLSAGNYNSSILITAPGAASQTVTVTLVVSNSASISTSPSSLNFAYQIGGPTQTQQVNISGTAGLAFTATAATTSGGSWLAVSPGSGTTTSQINVSLNTSALTSVGTFNGSINIAVTGAASQTVPVTVVVSNVPAIAASPSSVSFNYQIGQATPSSQSVSITGGSGISFITTVTDGSSWLSATPGLGFTPASINVSVNTTGLAAATYHGTISIGSNGASNTPYSIPVTLTVTGSTPTITLSPSSLNFTATVGGAAPASQTANVTATTPSPVTLSLSGGTWLSATLSGTTTPATVTVSASPSNLKAGTYTGSVIITSQGASNSPQTIAVQFVVSAATTIGAAPSSLSFAYILGSSIPAPQSISVTSSQAASFTAAVAGAPWLTLNNSSGSTPATITASVNPAGLPAGTFQAAISITSAGATNSPLVLSVTLVVANQPTLAPSPSSLIFTAQAGGSNPASQSINLSGSAPMVFTVSSSPAWLSVSSASGTTPSTLVVTVNIAGMSQGSYQGLITVASGTAVNSPLTIPVTLNLTVPLAVSVPTISSIVSAASYDNSGFAPGTIVTIFGSQLGPQAGAVFSVNSEGSLNNSLDGVTVIVEGVPAIPLYVQSNQINAILPFSLGTSGQADVEVTYNGQTSAQYNIPLAFSDIQIFTADQSGSGPGAILNQDNSVNTAKNPAAKGSIVSVYATGAGAVAPAALAGNVAGDVLSWVALPYASTVNGSDATVMYAGTAPTLVYGVDQFNVKLPANVPSGAVKIVLKVGDSASQPDVTVFVK
jgi:uncharacterized protein (TIGR03437 family)